MKLPLKERNELLEKELASKNRELKIEAALEKVRAIALSMKQPQDMPEVCKTISLQLQKLGVKEIRNVQTAVFYPERGLYKNYEYYAKHHKTFITETSYINHKVAKAFAAKMMKGKDEFFISHLTGKKLKEWFAYQKTTNVFIDKYLEKASSLNYYWYSLGPVALGISTYHPLTEEEENLFKRFLNVFELAYRRYLDVELAIGQAREARIETSLERVRAVAMSMKKSEEVINVCEVMYKELLALGFSNIRNAQIALKNDEKQSYLISVYSDSETVIMEEAPYNSSPIVKDLYDELGKSKDAFYQREFSGKKLEGWRKWRGDISAIKDKREIGAASIYFYLYSIGSGHLGISTFNAITIDQVETLKRFKNVFELSYTRYIDVANAEAQAKEAKIELALERVRARTMAMQRSEELLEVADVLFQQLRSFGGDLWGAGIGICQPESDNDDFYFANENGIFPRVTIPHTKDPTHKRLYKGWKNKEVLVKETKDGIKLKAHYDYLNSVPSVNGFFQGILDAGLTFPTWQRWHAAYFSHGYIMLITTSPYAEEQLLVRFAKVFDQAYIRFLDLQKAEAQAREAKIEAALERVRARSMAMHKSDELKEAGELLWNELGTLGIPSLTSGYVLMDENGKIGWIYAPNPATGKIEEPLGVLHTETKEMLAGLSSWKKQESFSVIEMDEQETIAHQTFIAEQSLQTDGTISHWITAEQLIAFSPKRLFLHNFNFKQGYLMIVGGNRLNEEQIELMLRFTKVFQQTYTRFLDLQKAEAQAREAEIELALERVRARTMAMQKSEELPEAANLLFQQIQSLGMPTWSAGYNILSDDKKSSLCIMSSEGETQIPFTLPLTEHESLIPWHEAIIKNDDLFVYQQGGEELAEHYRYLKSLPGLKRIFQQFEDVGISLPSFQINHLVRFKQGFLLFITYEPVPEAHNIFKRFANVFEQTYTRFLDLQKAEAQAREAQIETALERVRSRTMGMQHSGELKEAALLLFQQVQSFGVDQWACGYNIWEEDGKTCTAWMARQGALQPPFKTHPSVHQSFERFYEAKQRGENFYVEEIGGDEIKEHYKQLVSLPEFKSAPKEFFDEFIAPEFQIFHIVYFAQGYLMFITYKPVPEMWDIFKRFGKVFEQTYTRFIDLQKAEAQAREAQIEAALERVRASAMAMHTSEDLSQITIILREQIALLGEKELESILIHIYHEKADEFEAWYAYRHPGNQKREIVNGKVALDWSKTARARKDKEKYYGQKNEYTIVADYEMLKEWYEYLFEVVPVVVEMNDDGEILVPDVLYYNYSKISGGALVLITNSEASDQSKNLLNRAAKVFNLAYTRFLDLQKAEAQAREAVRQSSLDRVRGQIASMRSTEDLDRITPLIWHELTALDVPFIRCGVFIIDESNSITHVYLSSPDGHSLAVLNLPFDSSELTKNSVENWRKGLVYHQHWNKEEFINWTKSMMEMGQIQNQQTYQGAAAPPESLDLHFVPFTQGMLYVGNTNPLAEDEIDLVKSLAEAFSIAYARYEDFTKLEHAKQSIENTLIELKAAQKQLVQSEKMASLGELTAGIAHEIQNPLNFVNNFSEVSNELIDEMNEELDKGDIEEAKEIASDLKQNLEKINHHGKRAGDIVKGMLQHSRSSTGVKEPTDINVLADEYLRLSYHGLRAKDKSFNAKMETSFDESIGKINIIPQDIGRVLLNLFNNAFYACTERSRTCTEFSRSTVNPQKSKNLISYEPTDEAGLPTFQRLATLYEPIVSISTKKIEDEIEIKISDNGNGIPQNIVDKIFQPFFTTKPTGQGTGLGLSLSYDIIKAHGGEIKVESKEGEGSEFTIQLPVI